MPSTFSDKRFLILVFVTVLFIQVGHLYQKQIQVPLKKEIVALDGWSFSHIGFYMILGYWFPNKFWQFLFMGIVWELLEDFLSNNSDTKLVDCKKYPNSFWCNGNKDSFWYGKIEDVGMNIVGFIIGAYLRGQKKSM